MPAPIKTAGTKSRGGYDDVQPHRRIRQITSIQVRNLTPFPARDEFASALVQPSEQPQFGAHGHLSDDLDLTLGRRRGRRRSSTSVSGASLHTSSSHAAESSQEADFPARKRTISRGSIAASSSSGAVSTHKARITTNPPPVRPFRPRTISTTSSKSFTPSLSLDHTIPGSALTLSGFLRDTSQDALEHIIQSRLVETFLTVTIPSSDDQPSSGTLQPPPSTISLHASNQEGGRPARRSTITSSGSSTLPRSTASFRVSPAVPSSRAPRAGTSSSHAKSMSVSALPNGKSALKPSAPKSLSQRSPIPPALVSLRTPSPMTEPMSFATSSAIPAEAPQERPIPDYISPLHKPSTNPCFEIDPQEGYEFAPGADLKCSRAIVEIWGRVSVDTKDKGKGKERALPLLAGDTQDEQEWRVLKTWHVDLDKLVPLTEELAHHSSRLPSNTLCITLEPSCRTFYLPDACPSSALFVPSRSPSPSAGYNSDPESNVRHVETRSPLVPRNQSEARNVDILDDGLHERQETDGEVRGSRWKRTRTSASWQSMMKLVTLQACIQDTEQSVADVAREIELYLVDRSTFALSRETSEREVRVSGLRAEKASVQEKSESLRRRIREKQEELRNRRSVLSAAHEVHAEDVERESDYDLLIRDARMDLELLRSRLAPIRNELFTSLAFIFPIELLSPPDLLFTILDVPLPIPLGPTDPAPPLSLPSRKDVSDDTVATALGYAAQLVQLLAAYLSKRLVYPMTCIGSRSVIKDGISAMVGPRSFPLFSKSVDTYRFEYGVFLLNKDIEMLMMERNLRALDMRQTLPNLKNLLLTLTDPDTIEPRSHRPLSVASTTISALQSPILTPSISLPESNSQESQAHSGDTHREPPRIEIDSPPASGSTTPTRSATEASTPTNTVRKSRAFLDLAPLSGFFRARYPSSSRSSVKSEPPVEDDHAGDNTATISSAPANFSQTPEEGTGSGDDEDDRRTIRGTTSEDDVPERKHLQRAKSQLKHLPNGNGVAADHVRGTTAEEKLADKLRVSPQIVDVS